MISNWPADRDVLLEKRKCLPVEHRPQLNRLMRNIEALYAEYLRLCGKLCRKPTVLARKVQKLDQRYDEILSLLDAEIFISIISR